MVSMRRIAIYRRLGALVTAPLYVLQSFSLAIIKDMSASSPSNTSASASVPSSDSHSLLRTLFHYPSPSNAPVRSTAWLDGLRGLAALEVVLYHYHLQFLGFALNYCWGSQDFIYGQERYQIWRLPMLRNFIASGHSMVNVFYVISGFVLTWRSLKTIRRNNGAGGAEMQKVYESLSSAVFRRSMRLYIPACVISVVGMFLAWGGRPIPTAPQFGTSLWVYFQDWLVADQQFVNPFTDYEQTTSIIHRYEHVYWTLPLEFYGSIVVYCTVLVVSRIPSMSKRLFIVLMLMWFAYLKQNWWALCFLTGMGWADFILWQEENAGGYQSIPTSTSDHQNGFIMTPTSPAQNRTDNSTDNITLPHAISEHSNHTTKPNPQIHSTQTLITKAFWILTFLASWYIAGVPDFHGEYTLYGYDALYASVPTNWRLIEGGGRFWWSISGILMTCSISQVAFLRRICESRVCQYLGRISFMLYLVHSFLYVCIATWARQFVISHVKNELQQIMGFGGEPMGMMTEIPVGWGAYVDYFLFWIFFPPVVLVVAGQVTRWLDEPSLRFARAVERWFTDQI